MENKEIKTKYKHLCGDCKQELKQIGGFDMFSFLENYNTRFCLNKDCKMYGIVTVVSIPKEIKE